MLQEECKVKQDENGFSAEALARREQDILGQPPRIAGLMPDEMSAEQRHVIAQLRSAIDADDSVVSDYFLILAKHPVLLARQLEMGTALFRGQIPPRERELAILRGGWLSRAPYEWGEHVAVGKRFGLSTADIERVVAGSAAKGWTEHEAAILSAVDQLFADQMIDDQTWNTLAQNWTEQQLLELPILVGQYISIALLQNCIRLSLEPGNVGLSRR